MRKVNFNNCARLFIQQPKSVLGIGITARQTPVKQFLVEDDPFLGDQCIGLMEKQQGNGATLIVVPTT